MQVECIEAFGGAKPGDVAEVPDGAAVDPRHWRVVPPDAPSVVVTVDTSRADAAIASLAAALPPVTPLKEG